MYRQKIKLDHSVDVRTKAFVAIIALSVLLLSLLLRYDNIFNRPLLSHNEDATGHVLATLQAITKAPVEIHRYLPLITLSQHTGDLNVDNFVGGSIADNRGNYFYVSFPPLGFTLPSIIFTTIGVEPTLVHLRLLALALGIASSLLLYFLAFELAKDAPVPRYLKSAGSLCIAVLFFFNSETLWIFGNVYWHHVLMQPLLIGALLLLARYLRKPTGWRGATLAMAVFATCMVEWSGFTFAFGVMASGVYLASRKDKAGFLLVGAGAGAGIAALILILWHFAQVAELEAYLRALAHRPTKHLLGVRFLKDAAIAFSIIYGPLLLAGLLFGLSSRRSRVALPTEWLSRFLIVLFCAAASCAEAFFLLHHSVWYTYGSLPLMTFVLLLILFVILRNAPSLKLLAVGTTVFALVSAGVYRLQNPPDLPATAFAAQYLDLDKISAVADKDEAVFVNFNWALGVELARSGRNLITPNVVGAATASSITLDQLQQYIRQNLQATKGKMFIFEALRGKVHDPVWWSYFKSPVFVSPTERIGLLNAIVSFDLNGITDLRVRSTITKSLIGETATVSGMEKESVLLLRRLLAGTAVTCSGGNDVTFNQCVVSTHDLSGDADGNGNPAAFPARAAPARPAPAGP